MDTTTHGASTGDLRNALYAYALKLTGYNKTRALELLNETLSQITHNATAHNSIDSFMSHAGSVMRHANETTIHHADVQELYHLCYHGPETSYSPREIIHGMSLLTPHQATVVTLILKGYSTTEIARATGHSIQWVKTNTIKAIQCLRNIHTH